MKLKKITIIMGLILLLPLNIKALTADLDCGSNTNFHINSDVICKLFVNPEGSLISSFKADITYPNDITLIGIQSSWINSSTNNRIDMKMQTSTGNEGITNKTEIATLKFKTTTSYGDKQIKLSGGDLGQTVSIKEIHVISDNNKLKSLNVIGENIKFDKNVEEYVLKTNKDSIDIKAELDDTNARYEQNLGPRKVSLNYGEQTINIVVIAENNEKKTYTLKVTRQDNRSTNDNLSNIVVSFGELSPKFSKDVLNYTLEVPNNVESLTVTPTLEDKKAEFVSGYGPRTIDLKLGENIILIQTQAEKGNIKTYTIKVNRNDKAANNYLRSISLSKGTINFDKNIFEYKVNVDYNTKEFLISAIADEKTSSVEVVGDKELKVGENIYLIKVLAENKSERIYKIIVNRLEEGIVLSNNNYLANLSIKNHSIAFVKDKLNYDITLTNEETLDLKYDLEDEKAFVKIEGNNNLKNNSGNVLNEKEYRNYFKEATHIFTGVDYVKYFRDVCERENCEIEYVFTTNPLEILNYTKDVLVCNIHNRQRTKEILKNNGAKSVYGTDDILTESINGSGFNPKYGLLGSNMATDETLKLFPKDGEKLVYEIQEMLKEKTNKNIEVMVYGDGAFKDPVGKIWELADPVVSPFYTKGLEGTPNELKLKYLADNKYNSLNGEKLNKALTEEIKNKNKNLVGKNVSLGTTPRRYTDLLGSLADLTSGSGDKGTPVVLIQHYFDNYSD